MRLSIATLCVAIHYAPAAVTAQQTCGGGVSGPFTLSDVVGKCTYETLLEEYTRQVFDVAGATCASSGVVAEVDLDAKLMNATGAASGMEGGRIVCEAMYDNAVQTPFTDAADRGDDFHFEQMFYNGLSDWQDEVETLYESYDRSPTSKLEDDASKVREFYHSDGSRSRVAWPDTLTNFEASTCSAHAAMCCWPKDRQANDANGNCATPYDTNCVDKDPADNTNLCYADLQKGGASSGLNSDKGFMAFPGDNNDGEGAVHCHGFAWADDEREHTARYKANNLFFVSMYDHMHQRGYVKNIPGMPMCGCIDQMPVVTRSDCTQVDLVEHWDVVYDGESFEGRLVRVKVDFNACRGRGNKNNDLWAYAARLYDEGRMTAQRFGKVGRVLTNDGDCFHAVGNAKAANGYVAAYDSDGETWTQVAGRDEFKNGEPYGREAFNKAFFEQSLTAPSDPTAASFVTGETPIMMRICATCRETHKRVFYRRLTPVAEKFDLLFSILYHDRVKTGNVWNTDFTLHSTYEDAVTSSDPWTCLNGKFNHAANFDGECSPSGARVTNQFTRFHLHPGPRPNVAYYVNKPEDVGAKDYIENDDVEKAEGLTDVDIGAVGVAGNTLEDNGTFHITGSGHDIWGYSDYFHYKSQPFEGDVDVSVHVTNFANNGGNQYAKAGIMLRSDNSPDATYAFAQLTDREGVHFQRRQSKGNSAGAASGNYYKANPVQTSAWLRIVKKAETIEFYRGDGEGGWVLQATDTVLFPEDEYRVGLAVTSHSNNYLAEATFEDYVVESYDFPTAAPSVSSAPTAWTPLVEFNTQRTGEYYQEQGTGTDVLKGSGTGIWGTTDSFVYYTEQVPASGNLTVTMKIESFKNWKTHSRGGIMIRDSNDADAANVFVGSAGSMQGAVMQSRSEAGASTVHHMMEYVNAHSKFHVRLDKAGDEVTTYYKENAADEWTELGRVQLTLGASGTFQVGRAVSAGQDYQWALETMKTQSYVVSSSP